MYHTSLLEVLEWKKADKTEITTAILIFMFEIIQKITSFPLSLYRNPRSNLKVIK